MPRKRVIVVFDVDVVHRVENSNEGGEAPCERAQEEEGKKVHHDRGRTKQPHK